MTPLDAAMVEGKPHCPVCHVQATGIVEYGMDGNDRFWFVVVCPKCKGRVRYTREIRSL